MWVIYVGRQVSQVMKTIFGPEPATPRQKSNSLPRRHKSRLCTASHYKCTIYLYPVAYGSFKGSSTRCVRYVPSDLKRTEEYGSLNGT